MTEKSTFLRDQAVQRGGDQDRHLEGLCVCLIVRRLFGTHFSSTLLPIGFSRLHLPEDLRSKRHLHFKNKVFFYTLDTDVLQYEKSAKRRMIDDIEVAQMLNKVELFFF